VLHPAVASRILFSAMITLSETITAGAQSPVAKRAPRSTKKSIWWKRGEHLVQHTPTGTFYCRLKLKGKTIRASLNTDVFTTAQLRLPDKIKILRKPKAETGTFGDGRLKYEAESHNGYTSKKKPIRETRAIEHCLPLALSRMSSAFFCRNADSSGQNVEIVE